jgi:hypothetical protein
MITVVNKVSKPRKTNGILPSADEIIYDTVIPEITKKIKKIFFSPPVTVTISGKPSNFEYSISSDDKDLIKKIEACFK